MPARKITSWVGRALVVVVASVAALVLAVIVILPRMVDGHALTVLSGSMTPAFPVGSVVVVQPIQPEAVSIGDVITFANPDARTFTTHRVVEIDVTPEGTEFTTQGDANTQPDSAPVVAQNLRGRVWFHVPYIGAIRDAVATTRGLGIILALATLGMVWDRIRLVVRRLPGMSVGGRRLLELRKDHAARAEQSGDGQAIPADDFVARSPVVNTADAVQTAGVTVELCSTVRVDQQLLLARLSIGGLARGKVIELLGLVRGHVIAIGAFHMVVTVTGTSDHIDGVEDLLRPYGLIEASRSAVVSIGGESAPDSPTPAAEVPTTAPNTVTAAPDARAVASPRAEEFVEDLDSFTLPSYGPSRFSLAGAASNGREQ